jgi:hypothetical protein
MLKTTILYKEDMDISKYAKLIGYLKRKNQGYVPKISKNLNRKNIVKFFKDKMNEIYSLMKVTLQFLDFLDCNSCGYRRCLQD